MTCPHTVLRQHIPYILPQLSDIYIKNIRCSANVCPEDGRIRPMSSIRILSICICLLLLAACTMPAAPVTPTTDNVQNPAYTAAAETIVAQLTEIAMPFIEPTSTPTPTATPTETPVPSWTPSTTPTPPPTATTDPAAPTATEGPSPTVAPTSDPALDAYAFVPGLGTPGWVDNFDDASNWYFYSDEHIQATMLDGAVELKALTANKKDPWDGWQFADPVGIDGVPENFGLGVSATTGECSGLDRYGLVFRSTQDYKQAYSFGVSCDGKYSLRIWNGETYIMLIPWTVSQTINRGPGQTNYLGVKADGKNITVYVNGVQLVGVQDETFSAGPFGLFIGAVNTDGFTVTFDQAAYWALP